MLKLLDSERGISPILATLLLIVIAVGASVVTYAWITNFTATQTQQSGAIPKLENIRWYGDPADAKNRTDTTIRNTGTSDGKIVAVYLSDTSFSSLAKLVVDTDYVMNPSSGVIGSLSSITITVKWDSGTTTGSAWASGTTYYLKFVTESGIDLPVTSKAP